MNVAPRPLLVVQSNHVQRLTEPAGYAALRLGIPVHDLPYDATASDRPALPAHGSWSPVLVIGSVGFVDRWARRHPDLRKWVFWNDERYDAKIWADRMGDLFMNHLGRDMTIGSFTASTSGPMHIRPRSGVKMIGDVVRDENNDGRRGLQGAVHSPDQIAGRNVDPELPIWVSPPKRIDAEVRIWMIGGKPACWSSYRMDGRPMKTTSLDVCRPALDAAPMIHVAYHPDTHYVMDLGLVEGQWRLVEFNPIHSSGWYAASPDDMLEAFFASAHQNQENVDGDA